MVEGERVVDWTGLAYIYMANGMAYILNGIEENLKYVSYIAWLSPLWLDVCIVG